jgi:hypothetical protein
VDAEDVGNLLVAGTGRVRVTDRPISSILSTFVGLACLDKRFVRCLHAGERYFYRDRDSSS